MRAVSTRTRLFGKEWKTSVIEMNANNYTFGDSDRAAVRLRRLAELYEPETRDLLLRAGIYSPKLAVDLGCGPGWSTSLLQEVLRPGRTVGLDSSERYIAEARRGPFTNIDFNVHDVLHIPFPVQSPNVFFCRFLITHLSRPAKALEDWAAVAAPGATLLVHETESIESWHPVLRRYYDLVGKLQAHYRQSLRIGARLDMLVSSNGWKVAECTSLELHKSAKDMAELHSANLQTWRTDEYARQAFDSGEIDRLQTSLDRIAQGAEDAGEVIDVAKQIIAKRA